MFRPPLSAVSAGLLAAFVGFASTFPVVLQGLAGAGASPAQAASGLMALSVSIGLCAILVSLRTRMPIAITWSTPGAALLASGSIPQGGFSVAVGAFAITGLLIVSAGLFKPLGRLIVRVPASIANAMLAGILLPLCLAPVRAIHESPLAGLAIAGSWFLVGRWNRLLAVPAAAIVTLGMIFATGPGLGLSSAAVFPEAVLVWPEFTLAASIGIALPLFLVTMASQNIPGLAVLRVNGYQPSPGPLFAVTGLFTLAAVPFGGHSVNLAAMTAAICAGEEAGADRDRRWWAGVVSGFGYIAFGFAAGLITAFASQAPLLVQAMAGLALIGALSSSLFGAMTDGADREAAALTFLVTASGTAFFGISAPFWGLRAGGLVLLVARRRAAKPRLG